jgi:hypothetical protein
MSVHLVTFSDESMSRARELCEQSAQANGVRHLHRYALAHVEDLLLRSGINSLARGCGYWAWKPAIILETMNRLGRIDTAFSLTGQSMIIYADAGVEFINNVSHIIDRMGYASPRDDIWLFGNNWEHAHWCKRDVIDTIEPPCIRDNEPNSWVWTGYHKQCQASVVFFRVSDYTRAFVAEWLKWCLFEGGRLIDDSPSRSPNHPKFREHRHDQAILTTLAYREGIPLHYWPASYNDGTFTYEKLPEYAGDDYPVLFNHHRRRNHEWPK